MPSPSVKVPLGSARVVFMGTPEYAVPTLRRLMAEANVIAVFTQPDRPAGRGMAPRASAVKGVALTAGIPVEQPASLRRDPAVVGRLVGLRPDVIVVAAYGLILPTEVLHAPLCGCLNVHASLLPRWRGASPVHHAIDAGDVRTGSTIMAMDEGVDTGPIVAQAETDIFPGETTGQLTARLAELGADLLVRALPQWLAGRVVPRVQDDRLASLAPRLDVAQGLVDWQKDAAAIARHVRAMNPWPGAYTELPDGRRLKILAAAPAAEATPAGASPGEVLAGSVALIVSCGSGALRLDVVQPAGKRAMAGEEFLRGTRSLVGGRLGQSAVPDEAEPR